MSRWLELDVLFGFLRNNGIQQAGLSTRHALIGFPGKQHMGGTSSVGDDYRTFFGGLFGFAGVVIEFPAGQYGHDGYNNGPDCSYDTTSYQSAQKIPDRFRDGFWKNMASRTVSAIVLEKCR